MFAYKLSGFVIETLMDCLYCDEYEGIQNNLLKF